MFEVILERDIYRRGDSMGIDNNNNDSASDQIQIRIDELLRDKVEPILDPECCIYKVPKNIREVNKDAYTPHLISIGPIHHNDEQLTPMEKQKLLYLNAFCERVGKLTLEVYIAFLENNMEKIRKSYSEEYPDLNEFGRMILLDAIFIIELFLRTLDSGENKLNGEKDDYMFEKLWLSEGIKRDLLLIENQLPFFVLEKLYEHVRPSKNQDQGGFLWLARKYFQKYDPYHEKSLAEINKEKIFKQGWDKPKHFTDLIRFFFVPQRLLAERFSDKYDVSAATKLKGAGISFERASNGCLLDVTFTKKRFLHWFPCLSCLPHLTRLVFPPLSVDDSTEYVLRNLIAFEQCHYPQHHYICSYAFLLDSLIEEEEDVEVLVENEVIDNKLSSNKDLANLINSLCKNVVIKSKHYETVSKGLYEHYHEGFWNKNMAELRLVYFRNLWRGSATIVGLLVLLITVFNFVRTNIKDF